MKWKKRGVSTIIATVLIILLTIAAAALLAQFIVPYVKDSLSGSTECLNYRDYFQFKEKAGNNKENYNCYQLSGSSELTKFYGASISAVGNDSSLDIKGFNLVFIKSDGSTKPVRVIEEGKARSGSEEGIKNLDPSSSNLKIPKTGETYTYSYNSLSKEDFVE